MTGLVCVRADQDCINSASWPGFAPLRQIDGGPGRLYDFLIRRDLGSKCEFSRVSPMDIVYLLLVFALFLAALGFLRICERVQ